MNFYLVDSYSQTKLSHVPSGEYDVGSFMSVKLLPENWLGHLFFNSYSQRINIWPFNLQTYCKTVFDIVYYDFSEKLSCGSK